MPHFNVWVSSHLVQPKERVLHMLSMPFVPTLQSSVQQEELAESIDGTHIDHHHLVDTALQTQGHSMNAHLWEFERSWSCLTEPCRA